MLKTPNIAGHKRNQPQADQENPPYWLVFMELEAAVQANEKEKISVALVLDDTCYNNNLPGNIYSLLQYGTGNQWC